MPCRGTTASCSASGSRCSRSSGSFLRRRPSMSVVLWPVFNPEVASMHPHLEGKALLGYVPLLDEMARRVNVRTITSFMDTRPLPEGLGDPPIDDADQLDGWIAGMQAAEVPRQVYRASRVLTRLACGV